MAKVTFNKSGSGSETGRLIIPALMLKILDIKDSKEDTDRRISITFVDNKIRIKKQKDKVDDDTYNKASSVVTFYSSGKSSRSGKVIIPVDMLQRLKLHDETQYIIIKKHCVEGITQKELGQMLNMSQSAISRNIKKGILFLKKELEFEELMINV